MFYVYVLRSESTDRHYTGFCQDIEQRVAQHNAGISKSTKGRGPWTLLYSESFPSRSEALRRERFLKSGKGREELEADPVNSDEPRDRIESAFGGKQKVGSSSLSGRATTMFRFLSPCAVRLAPSPRI